MLIDTHCHLHDREFFTEKDALDFLKSARISGIGQIICIGTDPADSLEAKTFASAFDDVFWTFGIHPSEYVPSEITKKDVKIDKNLVAIGEIGLDYHYEPFDRTYQIRLLESMLQLASDLDLPVSFHVREAFDDFFAIIKNFNSIKGVIHSFSDSKKTLRKLLDTTDFYIGVNGLATYSTLPTPPLDRILLETDAPFLTPARNRGKINQPAYIRDIATFLSTKLGVSFEEVEEITTKNAKQLFHLPDSTR